MLLDHRIRLGIPDPDIDTEIEYQMKLITRLVHQRHKEGKRLNNMTEMRAALKDKDKLIEHFKMLYEDQAKMNRGKSKDHGEGFSILKSDTDILSEKLEIKKINPPEFEIEFSV